MRPSKVSEDEQKSRRKNSRGRKSAGLFVSGENLVLHNDLAAIAKSDLIGMFAADRLNTIDRR